MNRRPVHDSRTMVRKALEAATQEIARASTDQPRRQAEWMIETILNVNRVELYSDEHLSLTPDQFSLLWKFLKRRTAGEPLQYILGTADFRNITLKVDRRALIPRPETEGLVEIALEFLIPFQSPRILDIGTGCGAIALSLLDEHPGAHASGIDISREALDLAAENGDSLGLSDRVIWLEGDFFSEDFCTQFEARFDLITCNPPYVSQEDYRQLPPDIRLHEPPVAVTTGRDGLHAINRLADIGIELLREGCYFISEIGEEQGDESQQIYRKAGWDAHVRNDLSGKPRYLVARRV
jgi:release factor glutamine methyltransferase